MKRDKIVVITGPTAAGKTELALKLAKKYNGEIVSADSRAVYRDLNIGTAKVLGVWHTTTFRSREKREYFIYRGIIHHLVDFLPPKKTFSAADFAKKAGKAIAEILKRGRLPIICGGTGFWIDALLNPERLPDIPPDFKLRRRLEKQPAGALFLRLKKLDPKRAKTVDRQNKRRLIRAVEIAAAGQGSSLPRQGRPLPARLDVLFLGLTLPDSELKNRIRARFSQWLRRGLVAETKKLAGQVSKKRLKEIGLAYPLVAEYLAGRLTKAEMIERSSNSIYRYAKRQKTWFGKNKKIRWTQSVSAAERLAAKFLAKKKPD